jgi:hypothetical protein
MPGEERREMSLHRHRPDAGSPAAVRDAEGLVQVQMRNVGAEPAGRRAAEQRVEVRAVEVHLPAVLVDDLADLADVRLEHAVGRRVGDHDRREIAGVRGGLRGEIVEVDVARVVGGDHHDLATCHVRRRRVRAVRGPGHQHDAPVILAAAGVIRVDRDQASELALRPSSAGASKRRSR